MLVLNKKVFATWGVIRKFWKAFSDLDLVWIVFSVAATFRSVSGTSVMLSVGCWRSSSVFFVLVTWGFTLKLVNCTLQLKTAVGRFLIELLWSIIWGLFTESLCHRDCLKFLRLFLGLQFIFFSGHLFQLQGFLDETVHLSRWLLTASLCIHSSTKNPQPHLLWPPELVVKLHDFLRGFFLSSSLPLLLQIKLSYKPLISS